MKNFVDYMRQGPFLPSLFIGYVGWPYGWQHSFEQGIVYAQSYAQDTPAPVDAELPPMITLTQHQTAGHACNQLQLFGIFFAVKDMDLHRAATRHGYEDLWAPAKWSELVDWHATLHRFRLRFEHMEYRHMQEAFMPFGGESAFEYVRRKNLSVILPTGGRGEKCKNLFATYDDLHKYLHDAYERARLWRPGGEADDLGALMGCVYPPPCGAIVYENSD